MQELGSKVEFQVVPFTIRQHHPVLCVGAREVSQALASNEIAYSEIFGRCRNKAADYIDHFVTKLRGRFDAPKDPNTEQGERRKSISDAM